MTEDRSQKLQMDSLKICASETELDLWREKPQAATYFEVSKDLSYARGSRIGVRAFLSSRPSQKTTRSFE